MGRISGHLLTVAAFAIVSSSAIIADSESGRAADIADLTGNIEIAAATRDVSGSVTVTDMRVGKHPNKTRIVLDITKPTNLAFEVSGDGQALFIDLPTATWNAAPFSARHAEGVVVDYRFQSNGKSGGRLSVLTDQPIRIKRPFFVAPRGNMGHRIVIDMMPGPVPPTSYSSGNQAEIANLTRNSRVNRPRRNGTMVASLDTPHIGSATSTSPMRRQVTQNRIPQNQYPATTMPRYPQSGNQQYSNPQQHNPQYGAPQNRNPMIPQRVMPQQQSGLFGIPNSYIRLGAGLVMLSEATSTGAGNENAVEYQPGFGLSAAFGVDMQNRFRLEGEMVYTSNSLQKISGTAAGNSAITQAVGGDTSTLAFMANANYDFPNQTRLTPFVMGGFGLAGVFLNEWEANENAIADDTDWVLALQLGGGVAYDLDDRTKLELSYRYFETQAPEFGDSRTTPFESELAGHNFMLGARFLY